MKSREQYVKPYKEELEQFVEHVADVCKHAGFASIDDAYESILNKPVSDDEPTPFNGWQTAEDYYIMSLIDGIYEYEKEFYRANYRYDRILEKLASKNKVVGEKSFEAKQEEN